MGFCHGKALQGLLLSLTNQLADPGGRARETGHSGRSMREWQETVRWLGYIQFVRFC